MSNEQHYEGARHNPNSPLDTAPAMPENYLDASRAPDGIFPIVRYKGRYGLGCGQYQEFERYHISYKEAKEIAWSFFGTCGHVIAFIDEHGNLIDEEKGGIF